MCHYLPYGKTVTCPSTVLNWCRKNSWSPGQFHTSAHGLLDSLAFESLTWSKPKQMNICFHLMCVWPLNQSSTRYTLTSCEYVTCPARKGLSINLDCFGFNGAVEAALTGYELYRDLLFCLWPLPHISEEWHQPLPDSSPCKDPKTPSPARKLLLVSRSRPHHLGSFVDQNFPPLWVKCYWRSVNVLPIF